MPKFTHRSWRSWIITTRSKKSFRIGRGTRPRFVFLLVRHRCITSLPIELFDYETAAGHRPGRAVETWCPVPRTRAIITDKVYSRLRKGLEFHYGRSPTNWFPADHEDFETLAWLAWLQGGTTDVTKARRPTFHFFRRLFGRLAVRTLTSDLNSPSDSTEKSIRSELMVFECPFSYIKTPASAVHVPHYDNNTLNNRSRQTQGPSYE